MPSTFHAKVSATMGEGSVMKPIAWRGGGMLALDAAQGISRTHLYLEGLQGQESKHMHTLERFDMNSTFILEAGQGCTKKAASGKLTNMWDWVEKSSFSGKSSYLGFTLQNWEYTDESSTHFKLSIKEGTSEPVYFSKRQVIDGSVSELALTFMSWKVEHPPSWLIYVPQACQYTDAHVSPVLGDVSKVVYFANWQWDCADPACSSTVPDGSAQPNYACAEFAARSLAYGGFIPTLTTGQEPQGNYYEYSYNGQSYDLCLTTGLSSCLGALGFTKLPATASSVTAGVATFGDGGDGYFSHAVIGVSPQTIDAHNNARQNRPVTWDLFNGIDAAWGPPSGSTASAAASSSGSANPSSSSGSGNPSSSSSSGSGNPSSSSSSSSPSSSASSSSPSSSSSSSYTGAASVVNEKGAMPDLSVYDVKKANPLKTDTPLGIMRKDTEGKEHLRMPEVADAPAKENMQVREEKAWRKFFA
jgi:hypothetical protein